MYHLDLVLNSSVKCFISSELLNFMLSGVFSFHCDFSRIFTLWLFSSQDQVVIYILCTCTISSIFIVSFFPFYIELEFIWNLFWWGMDLIFSPKYLIIILAPFISIFFFPTDLESFSIHML